MSFVSKNMQTKRENLKFAEFASLLYKVYKFVQNRKLYNFFDTRQVFCNLCHFFNKPYFIPIYHYSKADNSYLSLELFNKTWYVELRHKKSVIQYPLSTITFAVFYFSNNTLF